LFFDGLKGFANFADVAGLDLAAVGGNRDGEGIGGVCKDAVRALAACLGEAVLFEQHDDVVQGPGGVALEAGEFGEKFAAAAYA